MNRFNLPPKPFYFLSVLFSSNKIAQRNYELLHLISCLLGGNKQKSQPDSTQGTGTPGSTDPGYLMTFQMRWKPCQTGSKAHPSSAGKVTAVEKATPKVLQVGKPVQHSAGGEGLLAALQDHFPPRRRAGMSIRAINVAPGPDAPTKC